MKKLYAFSFFAAVSLAFLSAQNIMTVEKTDNTTANFDMNTIQRVSFKYDDVNEDISKNVNNKCIVLREKELIEGQAIKVENFPRYSKKGNSFSMRAKISSFESVIFGIGYRSYRSSWIEIDKKSISLYKYEDKDILVETFQHGLEISDFISMSLRQIENGNMYLILQSLTGDFTATLKTTNDTNGIPQLVSNGSILSDVQITCGNKDFKNEIWMFGDSYFGINSIRWVGWLKTYGYGKGLYINGLAGLTSKSAIADLKRALEMSTPKYLFWCLGMNDTFDAWKSFFNEVNEICNEKGIILISATIPTVPTRDNNDKNEVVKDSGLRYVDFADAVESNPQTGEWKADYLSSDGVHPSASGARVLALRAICDFPEITQTEFSTPSISD